MWNFVILFAKVWAQVVFYNSGLEYKNKYYSSKIGLLFFYFSKHIHPERILSAEKLKLLYGGELTKMTLWAQMFSRCARELALS